MALQKDAVVEQYGVTLPDAWWVPGEVYINPLVGMARIIPIAFKSEDDWNLLKQIRVLRAKQHALQKDWRQRREAHNEESDGAWDEPEPFLEIPLVPPYIVGEAIEVGLDQYLEMEQKMKAQKVNFFAFLYTDVLKNSHLTASFADAKDA